MTRNIGDQSLWGPLDGVTVNGFLRADTRIQVALPSGPEPAVQFVVFLGLGSSVTVQADRDQLIRLRDTLTEALDAELDPEEGT